MTDKPHFVTERYGSDSPAVTYALPQHVLVPDFEYREDQAVWVAKLPFFGFFTYGEEKEEALSRLRTVLCHIFDAHAEKVLAGEYTVADVSRGVAEWYKDVAREWKTGTEVDIATLDG